VEQQPILFTPAEESLNSALYIATISNLFCGEGGPIGNLQISEMLFELLQEGETQLHFDTVCDSGGGHDPWLSWWTTQPDGTGTPCSHFNTHCVNLLPGKALVSTDQDWYGFNGAITIDAPTDVGNLPNPTWGAVKELYR
jgi:hypothetical protein